MKYCCESCGKTFTKEEEALACENTHKAEQELRVKKLEERKARWGEVEKARCEYKKLYDKYAKDYKIGNLAVGDNISTYPYHNVSLEDLIRLLI